MVITRELRRDEIAQIWGIDRREVIENVYHLEEGALALKPEHYDMQGWPRSEPERYAPILYDCFDHGGWFCGLFDGERLIGITILDSRFIGMNEDQLQLKFLHISHDYRRQGLGKRLFEMASAKASEWGARQMYISATPSQNTVDFYPRLGAVATKEPDPELLALEPEDVHMEYRV